MIRSYKLAKKNLRSHRTRTLLTVLGVMIGVFIISLVMIISGSLKQSIVNQVSALNGRIVVIRSGSASQTGMSAFSPLNMSPVSTLGKKDIETVAKTADIENSAPMIFASGGISGQENDYKNSNIVATTSSFAKNHRGQGPLLQGRCCPLERSMAAPRCAALTPTHTARSPIARSPTRCTHRASMIANFPNASCTTRSPSLVASAI